MRAWQADSSRRAPHKESQPERGPLRLPARQIPLPAPEVLLPQLAGTRSHSLGERFLFDRWGSRCVGCVATTASLRFSGTVPTGQVALTSTRSRQTMGAQQTQQAQREEETMRRLKTMLPVVAALAAVAGSVTA